MENNHTTRSSSLPRGRKQNTKRFFQRIMVCGENHETKLTCTFPPVGSVGVLYIDAPGNHLKQERNHRACGRRIPQKIAQQQQQANNDTNNICTVLAVHNSTLRTLRKKHPKREFERVFTSRVV